MDISFPTLYEVRYKSTGIERTIWYESQRMPGIITGDGRGTKLTYKEFLSELKEQYSKFSFKGMNIIGDK